MSLHVVSRPSAPASPLEEDEEKTTLDGENADRVKKAAAEWEDGTTVEESTIAQAQAFREKVVNDGAGNTTNTTGTDGRTLDELTVEEHARPLAPLQLVPAAEPAQSAQSTAKLICISGTDTGREFDVVAGKPITIGRAIDNDVVLTDISVSRKHFDLIYEGERWTLRDRGSGNGTLINERMEDGSCQLHHGDRIEIGNTAFRFDHPSSSAQGSRVGWGDRDDEDARTVAGKPPGRDDSGLGMPGGPIAKPATTLPGPPVGRRESGNRALPQPHARTSSSSPAVGGAIPGLPAHPPGMTSGPNAPTLGAGGAPQMYPVMQASPGAPTMAPFAANQMAPEPMRLGVSQPLMADYPAASPSDLAGRGRYPSSNPSQQPAEPRPLPMADRPDADGSRWAIMAAVAVLVIGMGIIAVATDSAAANAPPVQITAPKIKRPLFAKLDRSADEGTPAVDPSTAPTSDGTKPGPTVEPIEPGDQHDDDGKQADDTAKADATAKAAEARKADEIAKADAAAKAATATAETAKAEQARLADEARKADEAKQAEAHRVADQTAADDKAAAAAQRKADQKAADDKAAAKAAADAQRQAEEDAKKADAQRLADKRAADDRRAEDQRLVARRAAENKKAAAQRLADRKAADDRRREAEERKAEMLAERKAERERKAREARDASDAGPRVATADVESAMAKANTQYEAASFVDAAKTLSSAAKGAEGGVADDLRSQAANYRAVGDGITAGRTEASAKPVDTLLKLKSALAADRRVGGLHTSTIRDMIGSTAPRAAVSHMAKGNLEGAYAATVDAVNNGSAGDSNVKSVRKTLESRASELYSTGSKANDRSALNRVLKIVPKDSIWYQKAQKALQK